MRRLILIRIFWTIPILVGVSFVAFVLLRAIPGNYAEMLASNGGATFPNQSAILAIQKRLGLNHSVLYQYVSWLHGAISGNLGKSYVDSLPVSSQLLPRLGVTAELAIIAMIMAVIMGVTTGLLAALGVRRVEWFIRGLNSLILGIPSFVTATIIVLVTGLYIRSLHLFNYVSILSNPISSIGDMLAPAFCLALGAEVVIAENVRGAVLEILNNDYVTLARANGLLPRTILVKYLLKNALTPVITVVGLQLAALLGGSIIIESIFGLPGMGQWLYDSVQSRDYPVIQAIVIVAAFIVLVVNLLVDIAYMRVDARASV